MRSQKYTMDMCNGPIFSKMIRYSLPLVLTYLLQFAFHAADLIVIGRFSSHESLAAIGTTSSIIALQVNFFVGISVGANVVAAQLYGAKDTKKVSRTTHTTMALAVIVGFIVLISGCLLARWLLVVTDVPGEILEKAWLYLIISFLGAPFLMIYNFGCAILRALGDTRRPLYYLTIAGVANVLLNLVFVLVFKMDVAGVGLATMASKILSAWFVVQTMRKSHGVGRLILRNIRIDWELTKQILKTGIPAGIQSACFALSNTIIQSGVNFFGSAAVAGITASNSLEAVLYALSYGMHQTMVAFVGQNFGAKKYDRLKKVIKLCLSYTCIVIFIMSSIMWIFGDALLNIFSTEPEVKSWGMLRIGITFSTYFLLGAMEGYSGALRGLGHSLFSAISSISGACILRIIWVSMIFKVMAEPSMSALLISYPVSWFMVSFINAIVLWRILKKLCSNTPANSHYITAKI